jgi:hypothetical protein
MQRLYRDRNAHLAVYPYMQSLTLRRMCDACGTVPTSSPVRALSTSTFVTTALLCRELIALHVQTT